MEHPAGSGSSRTRQEPQCHAHGGGCLAAYRAPLITLDNLDRLTLKIAELNRVLGGGIVPGSCVLVGGDPGIGKSTLLLQMASEVAQTAGPVLYVSAEESAHQIKRRADRLSIKSDKLFVYSEIEVESILDHASSMRPKLMIVDSIQAIYSAGSQARRAQFHRCVTVLRHFCALANRTTCRSFWLGM